jgi:hypothetical protein
MFLFSPNQKAQGKVSLADWAVEKGVFTEGEMKDIEDFVGKMVEFEGTIFQGSSADVDSLISKMGPSAELVVSVLGSSAGTRLQKFIAPDSGTATIIAAGRGAEAFRTGYKNVFKDLPNAFRIDLLKEIIKDPEALAMALKEGKTAKEKSRMLSYFKEWLVDKGLIAPMRRALPGVATPDDQPVLEESNAPEPLTLQERTEDVQQRAQELINQQSSLQLPARMTPPVPAQRVAPPTSTLASAAPPPPPPAASGPVNRDQYAALFPNDIASGMIRQQGTALMADGGAVRHLAAGGRADGPGSENFGSEASQHGSGGGGYTGNDGAGDQNRSMTPEERYADNARRLGQTYISDYQNQSMTPEERYADNFARLSANLPQSIPSNSAVSLTVTPQEKRQVLSQVNKVAQQSLQPDAVIDFRQRLAAGQFDPQKAALNPAQARAAALNPTLAGFVQPGAGMGITSLPSIQTNTNMEQPTVAPEASFSGLPVGEGKLMGQYDPATGKVELVYTRQYARGGAVNLGIGNLFRRRV